MGAALVVLAAVAMYWLPTFVAWLRHVSGLGQVIVVNGLTGWTFIGWVVALVMAFRPARTREPVTHEPLKVAGLIVGVVVGGIILTAAGAAAMGSGGASSPAATGRQHAQAQAAASAPAAPTLGSGEQQFVSDMRQTFSFDSSVPDSDIASFGDQTCADLKNGSSVASEVPGVRGQWSRTSKGDAIQMVTLAIRDICPDQARRQTVTYVVSGSPADVTYGPSGSDHSGTVPMSVTRRLGHPSYYAIDAQLNGDARVVCKIKVDGVTLSSGSASGAYNIASCQIGQDLNTESWANEN
jgi:hypothetical protein